MYNLMNRIAYNRHNRRLKAEMKRYEARCKHNQYCVEFAKKCLPEQIANRVEEHARWNALFKPIGLRCNWR